MKLVLSIGLALSFFVASSAQHRTTAPSVKRPELRRELVKRYRIRTGTVTYSSFVRVPESVLIHGDTVIVMGREEVVPKGNSPDAGKTINRRYTNIFMKRNGRWRLVARHASVICQN